MVVLPVVARQPTVLFFFRDLIGDQRKMAWNRNPHGEVPRLGNYGT